MDHRRGVLTLAYGSTRYHEQAGDLALSLRRHSPRLPLALATDRPEHPATRRFDQVVPLTGRVTGDCGQKLLLDRYTPFAHTLYLDSDSLAVRAVEPCSTC